MVSDIALKQAVDRLAERFRPSRIILFGSQARGTADDRSDVDLIVICRIEGSRRGLMVDMDRTLAGLGFARDIIALTPEEYERDRRIPGTVARFAAREGRILYERA
jgi:predicted nucleotidyltransferase